MTGQIVAYVRVSSTEQRLDRQIEGIRQSGITPDKVFADHLSGKDTKRDALQECLRYVREGDTLIAYSIDRLARNLLDLQHLVSDLTGRGVTVRFVREALTFGAGDAASPMDALLMHVLGAFAEFERALIRERQREGIELAKAQGRKFGRGKCVTPEQWEAIKQRLAAGEPIASIARAVGVSRPTIHARINGDPAAQAALTHGRGKRPVQTAA